MAIDALNEYFARIGKLKRRGLTKGEKAISLDTVGVIETLPSAQPEIIKCKECVYADDNYHCDYMTTWNDGDCFCCYGKRGTDGRFDKNAGGD